MDFRDTVQVSTLTNGLTVVTDTLPDNPVMYASISMLSGGLHDPWDKLGISHLGEHMIGYGLEGESREQFYSKNNIVGFKTFNMGTSDKEVSYFAYGDCEDVIPYLTEMAERLTTRAYNSDALKLEIDRITTEMRDHYADTNNVLMDLCRRASFGQGDLTKPFAGYVGGFDKISLQDIADHHERLLVGRNMALICSGGWSHDKAVEWAQDNLSHFPSGVKVDPLNDAHDTRDIFFNANSEDTVKFGYYFPFFKMAKDSEIEACILANILNNTLSPISDYHGLYHIGSGPVFAPSRMGSLGIQTSCRPEQVRDVAESIMNALEQLPSIIPDEIETTSKLIAKSMRLSNGTDNLIPENRISKLSHGFLSGDVYASSTAMQKTLDATPEGIMSLLETILSQKPGVLYYGAVTDDLPTGEMIQRRDFEGLRGDRPAIIRKFSPF